MSAEKLKRPIVELKASLSIGHSSPQDPNNYNLIFGDWVGVASEDIRQKNAQALGDVLERSPQINRGLALVRSDRETTQTYHGEAVTTKETRRDLYEGRFEGSFEVPWIVRAKVVDGEVVADYQVHLIRPDKSLEYVLRQSKKPDFHYPYYYGGEARKGRTRIDGLIVWLRMNGWEIADITTPGLGYQRPNYKDIPSSYSLVHKGLKEISFPRKEGKGARLAHIDRFIGSWYERWFLYEEDGQRNVTRMEVKLKGSWEDNLPAAR